MDTIPVPQSVGGGLPGVQQLIKEMMGVLAGHWKNLVRFSVLSALLSYGAVALAGLGVLGFLLGGGLYWPVRTLVLLGILFVIGIVVVVLLSLLINTALLESLRAIRQEGRDLGLKEAFQLGRRRMWGLALVGLLTGLVIAGGFILLIIPGIICAVWFMFSSFVFLNENISGRAALHQSKRYVSGRWWAVFGRMVAFWFVSVVASLVLNSLVGAVARSLGPVGHVLMFVEGLLLNIILSLATLTYFQLLYEAVRGSTLSEAPAPAPVLGQN